MDNARLTGYHLPRVKLSQGALALGEDFKEFKVKYSPCIRLT